MKLLIIPDFSPNNQKWAKEIQNVLCLQNESDPLASFTEVEQFIHAVNPKNSSPLLAPISLP